MSCGTALQPRSASLPAALLSRPSPVMSHSPWISSATGSARSEVSSATIFSRISIASATRSSSPNLWRHHRNPASCSEKECCGSPKQMIRLRYASLPTSRFITSRTGVSSPPVRISRRSSRQTLSRRATSRTVGGAESTRGARMARGARASRSRGSPAPRGRIARSPPRRPAHTRPVCEAFLRRASGASPSPGRR